MAEYKGAGDTVTINDVLEVCGKYITNQESIDLINRAYDFMRTLDEVLHRDIVYARYIVGLPWNDVAKTFNYSNQRIFQKHREILRKL